VLGRLAQAMRYARALFPPLKQPPADAASVSHVLLPEALDRRGVELKPRRERNPKQTSLLPLDPAAKDVLELVQHALRVPLASKAA
jgi:hypothetical protein